LEHDVSESRNVAAEFPQVVEDLLQAAQRARQELGDRLTDTTGTGTRPPGKLLPADARLIWEKE
jgi:hypothetical protein